MKINEKTSGLEINMKIIKGKSKGKPYKITIYGDPGVGKSTLAATASAPIFLNLEDGLSQIDCHRTEAISSTKELKDATTWLLQNRGEYKTVVLDTADALDFMIAQEICKKHKKDSLSDFGFGRGYDLLNHTWNKVLDEFDMLCASGYNIIITAHPTIKRYEDPTTEGYDKITLKMNQKPAGTIIGRMDGVFYYAYEKILRASEVNDKKKKARGTGDRILHTKNKISFDAKNRFDLPDEIIVNDSFNLTIFENKIKGE